MGKAQDREELERMMREQVATPAQRARVLASMLPQGEEEVEQTPVRPRKKWMLTAEQRARIEERMPYVRDALMKKAGLL